MGIMVDDENILLKVFFVQHRHKLGSFVLNDLDCVLYCSLLAVPVPHGPALSHQSCVDLDVWGRVL